MVRNTNTGGVLEQMVLPALTRGGYSYAVQVNVGVRLGGRRHVVDVVASRADETPMLISMKWQQTSGTAEQKVPYEVMCLTAILQQPDSRYGRAYLVLGGGSWTLRDFYAEGGLDPYLAYPGAVTIMALEPFVARAMRGEL